jgi:hypothetical protein
MKESSFSSPKQYDTDRRFFENWYHREGKYKMQESDIDIMWAAFQAGMNYQKDSRFDVGDIR